MALVTAFVGKQEFSGMPCSDDSLVTKCHRRWVQGGCRCVDRLHKFGPNRTERAVTRLLTNLDEQAVQRFLALMDAKSGVAKSELESGESEAEQEREGRGSSSSSSRSKRWTA